MKFGSEPSAMRLTITSLANGAGGQHLRAVAVVDTVAAVQIDLVAASPGAAVEALRAFANALAPAAGKLHQVQ